MLLGTIHPHGCQFPKTINICNHYDRQEYIFEDKKKTIHFNNIIPILYKNKVIIFINYKLIIITIIFILIFFIPWWKLHLMLINFPQTDIQSCFLVRPAGGCQIRRYNLHPRPSKIVISFERRFYNGRSLDPFQDILKVLVPLFYWKVL